MELSSPIRVVISLSTGSPRLSKIIWQRVYYVFVEYNFNTKKEIVDVKIAPFYEFLALNRDGLLRYREKDGNLRPKDFSQVSTVKSFYQFQSLFKKTEIYRSIRIIKKHLKNIPKKEAKKIFNNLKF